MLHKICVWQLLNSLQHWVFRIFGAAFFHSKCVQNSNRNEERFWYLLWTVWNCSITGTLWIYEGLYNTNIRVQRANVFGDWTICFVFFNLFPWWNQGETEEYSAYPSLLRWKNMNTSRLSYLKIEQAHCSFHKGDKIHWFYKCSAS